MQCPAAEHAAPDAAFDVDDGAVGITAARRHAHQDALVGQQAGTRAIEGVDDAGQRIRVIESLAVRALGRTVGDDVAGIAAYAAVVPELVERAARILFGIVHRSEPEETL